MMKSKNILCLTVNLSSCASLPISPVAAQATAIDCGEIIFPVTPPDELAAMASSGFMPTDWAETCWSVLNKTLDEVSEPVMKTPSQPSTGEKNGNNAAVLASANANVVIMPEAFMTYAKPTMNKMVRIGNFNSFNVSKNAANHAFHEIFKRNFVTMAAIKIAVPAVPSRSSLYMAAIGVCAPLII